MTLEALLIRINMHREICAMPRAMVVVTSKLIAANVRRPGLLQGCLRVHGGSRKTRAMAVYPRHSTAFTRAALRAAIPAWYPFLPGLTCPGRSASWILTSPTLRATEVRIPPAPLRE